METPFWRHFDAGDGLHVAFTSVRAGNLALSIGAHGRVRQHRRALEARLGVAPESLRFLHQVHSADVVDADGDAAATESEPPVGDAWLSTSGRTPLAIMVADCLPIMFVARDAHGTVRTAGAHAGRVGLLAGVLEHTVEALRLGELARSGLGRAGLGRSRPETEGGLRITAWIGPGACGRCYEVPEELRAEASRGRPALYSETSWGTPALDLRAEAAAVLPDCGVEVVDVAGCTIEDQALFSHRRAPGQGRFAGVVWRR